MVRPAFSDPWAVAPMNVRRCGASAPDLDAALVAAGLTLGDDDAATAVHVVPAIDALSELTPTVVAWAAEARTAVAAGADVVTVVAADGFDTDATAPSMLAHGLVAATRALAMEHARDGGRANLVVVGDAAAEEVAATVRWLVTTPSATAEVVTLGAARHGRQPA